MGKRSKKYKNVIRFKFKYKTRNYKQNSTLPLEDMDIVLDEEWLMQLGSYTTNLEE